MKRYTASEVEPRFRARRLKYPKSARLSASIAELFGAPLTPEEAVRRIVSEVAEEGDPALDRWGQRLDRSPAYEVPKKQWREAYDGLASDLREALEAARTRIRDFHRQEPRGGFVKAGPDGLTGQLVRPLERVGVYVPGGGAPLLSTVLMTVVPARVAGVKEIIIATPPDPHPAILAAAWIAGADRLFAMGGAQAIAALAYGTARVPRVEKIVGPGNLFVTLAKKEVFGDVGIEGLAGPTETLIIADQTANPALVAADLLAQAEHDRLAEPWLITLSEAFADAVEREVGSQLAELPRREVAEKALENGGIVIVESLEVAMRLANLYAPEHLCLSVEDPYAWLGQVQNAGGVFLGEHSGEAFGDYIAGPSHVMPTSGTARFTTALAVRDFVKVIPFVSLNPETAARLAGPAARLARSEGLEGHARALDRRGN